MASKHGVITATDVEKDLKINSARVPHKRKCSQCNGKYFRRNLMEQWTGRNIGHRYGWFKEVAKVCLDCMSEYESKRIIGIADVNFGKLVKLGK